MRHEDFNMTRLLDLIDTDYSEVDVALTTLFPGMLKEDLTETELDFIEDKTIRCDNCYKLTCTGLQYNEVFRGDLCDDCYWEYGEEDEEYYVEDEE